MIRFLLALILTSIVAKYTEVKKMKYLEELTRTHFMTKTKFLIPLPIIPQDLVAECLKNLGV